MSLAFANLGFEKSKDCNNIDGVNIKVVLGEANMQKILKVISSLSKNVPDVTV